MSRLFGVSSLCVATLITSACTNNSGRPQFISDGGVSKEVNAASGVSPIGDGLLFQFKLAAEEAKPFTAGPNASLKANDPKKQRAFMEAGFALIQARCNKYILSKSDSQRRVNVWRDTFAPITALLTGAVALIGKGDDTSNDALTALSLGTSAASAGFRIYEQRYLFGAENVDSVRRLIQNALVGNAAEASKTKDEKLTYSQSVTHLINNQAVCSPGHILHLVSAAIKTGDVVSMKSDTPPASEATKSEEELKELKALLEQLKTDKAITDQQISVAKAKMQSGQPPAPPPSLGLEIVTTDVRN
ncbi:MAG: hypothetical protein LKM31_12660 [Sphingobium sp.]|jgi:hypothetical protein|nr:hypothetical protein [Sphingobium sp.]